MRAELPELVTESESSYENTKGENKLYRDFIRGKKTFFFSKDEHKTIIKKVDTIDDYIEAINKFYEDDESYRLKPYTIKDEQYISYRTTANFDNSEKMVSKIDNGFYSIGKSQQLGWFLTEQEISKGSDYIQLGGIFDEISTSVAKFYDDKQKYAEYGEPHKQGMLLFGPAGTGKSCLLRQLMKEYQNKAVIIFIDSDFPMGLISKLKDFDQQYIFVFEELTQNLRNSKEIGQILNFLDGEHSLNQQLVFATTNYPEDLEANMANRPGRFDELYRISNPSREIRRTYLEAKGMEVTEEILDLTEGHSVAYLKRFFMTTKLKGLDFKTVIKQNEDRMKMVKKHFADPAKEQKIGL